MEYVFQERERVKVKREGEEGGKRVRRRVGGRVGTTVRRKGG